MQPRAFRESRISPNPFRTSFHWVLGPDFPHLELESAALARTVVIPERPTLLTGAAGSGRRATLDRIAEHAERSGWFVVRVDARVSDLDEVVCDAKHAGAHAGVPVGVLVCIDELHAANRVGCTAVLAAIESAHHVSDRPPLRIVASATHRSSLAADERACDVFDDIELVLDIADVATTFGEVAATHGRELGNDAAQALHRASAGVAGAALELAAVAWDTTRGDVITPEHIAQVRARVEAEGHSRLRATYSSRFSLGQRRYLRAVASRGANHAGVDEVKRALCELAYFEISDSMLEAVSTTLVREGVLIVRDGVATIAAPGLADAM